MWQKKRMVINLRDLQRVNMADKGTSERLREQETRSVAGKGSEMLGERQARSERGRHGNARQGVWH